MLQECSFPYICDQYPNNSTFYICPLFWLIRGQKTACPDLHLPPFNRKKGIQKWLCSRPKGGRAHRTPEETQLPVRGDCAHQVAQGTSVFKCPVPISPYVPSWFLDQPGWAPEDMEPRLSIYIHLHIKQVSLTSYAHHSVINKEQSQHHLCTKGTQKSGKDKSVKKEIIPIIRQNVTVMVETWIVVCGHHGFQHEGRSDQFMGASIWTGFEGCGINLAGEHDEEHFQWGEWHESRQSRRMFLEKSQGTIHMRICARGSMWVEETVRQIVPRLWSTWDAKLWR